MYNVHSKLEVTIAAEIYFSLLKDLIGASISSGTHSLVSERLKENLQLNQYRKYTIIYYYTIKIKGFLWLAIVM